MEGKEDSRKRGLGLERLPPGGVILGAGITGPLSQAPIREYRLGWGDHLVATTHAGYGYKSLNEDRVALVEVESPAGPITALFVIDGMGGREGGDIAAQILAEELILATQPGNPEVQAECARFVEEKIESTLWALSDRGMAQRTVSRWKAVSLAAEDKKAEIRERIRQALDAVNAESLELETIPPGLLREIAETIRVLSELTIPDPFEIAGRRTRRRIALARPGPAAPDACFIGGIIRPEAGNRRMLDVRQVGDCKLFVASSDGSIRFQSTGESVIAEPDLEHSSVNLTDLMAYSLHRNLVRNSINGTELALKRYRSQDVPIALEEGDLVCLYSDGVDDIFTPSELLGMMRGRQLGTAFGDLLLQSERRMKFVSGRLRAQRKMLPEGHQRKAYPLVHEGLNRQRIRDGCYVEAYRDGAEGRWMKPPKCDNLSICALFVKSMPVDA